MAETSINKLRKDIKQKYFSSSDDISAKSMKTLLVKVLEEKPTGAGDDVKILSDEHREKLLSVLDFADKKRLEYLQWCYNKFQKESFFFFEHASKLVYKHNNEFSLYTDENNNEVKKEFICSEPECNEPLYVHQYGKKFTA